jgi:hypothetical protein
VVKLGELGRLGRLGKRKNLSVIIPRRVLENTGFSLFSPSYPSYPRYPSLFHDDLTMSALLPPGKNYVNNYRQLRRQVFRLFLVPFD